jgi:hypothetical protein
MKPSIDHARTQISEQVKSKRLIPIFMILAATLAACGALGNDDDSSGEFWSPFSSQSYWEVGDGRILVELTGYERGHEPGKTAEFTIKVENRREQPANLDMCTKLVDEREIIQRFERFAMNLDADSSEEITFIAALEEEIEPRAYGLAVVISETGAIVHTVRVGIPDDEAGPWLDAESLVCD